jgi:hypothetical protein
MIIILCNLQKPRTDGASALLGDIFGPSNEEDDDTSSVESSHSSHDLVDVTLLDLTQADVTASSNLTNELVLEDKKNARMRANQFLQLQYPAIDVSTECPVLSFYFGIRAIVLNCLDVKCVEFDMLQLVALPELLNSCVCNVKNILCRKHSNDIYLGDLSIAFGLLRDKHILSVICKVLLLPMIMCWFSDMLNQRVLMKGPPMRVLVKNKLVDVEPANVFVKVVTYQCGGKDGNDVFHDIESFADKTVDDPNCGIDYFHKF